MKESFNRRFWSAELNHLYDVVDGPAGDDPACRRTRSFRSLDRPVLDQANWHAILETVQKRLLTPFDFVLCRQSS